MERLTIVSHNIFWLQGAPFPTDQPAAPDKRVLPRLCGVYEELGADVLCLQEVQRPSVFEVLARQLQMRGCYCPGGRLTQYGGAVLWRNSLARPLGDASGAPIPPQRMWQTVEIEAHGRQWTLCNLHLPSARQLGREKASTRRLAELVESLGCRDASPDMVVGDFNEAPGGPVERLMRDRGYVNPATLDGRAAAPTTIAGGISDYIWIKAPLIALLHDYRVLACDRLACNLPGKSHLSDHLPLRLVLEA